MDNLNSKCKVSKISVKLFHKEPDMKCWNCDQLISHKQTNSEPRKLPIDHLMKEVNMPPEDIEFVNKEFGKNTLSSPNQIFGVSEYEYRGKCPSCGEEQALFWFGVDSIKKNKDKIIQKKPFFCHECKNQINRELQIWYSIRFQEGDKITEYLVTLCPNCKTEQGYPFEYDLSRGIIK